MAVLVILLLAPFLPYTALAAFSPPFSFFISCGAASNVSFPSDSPARTFIPDTAFLSPAHVPAVNSSNSNPTSPLYAAARAANSTFSYSLPYPASAAQNASLVLRLHFFPFSTSRSPVNLSSARFTVLVLDAYTLLSSFSPPSAGVVKEFFVPPGSSGDFHITFTPDAGSAAFVNAVELFPAPPELLGNRSVTQVGAAAGDNIVLWQQQALETVYRLNVGGPKVTKENDTLWRTWLPDDPYIYAVEVSVLDNTSSPIVYDQSAGYTREVAPDVVYKTQRAMSVTEYLVATNPGLNFNVTWTFPAEPGSDYLVRLHFCDYEVLSSVVGAGLVFNVYVAQAIASQDLAPKDYASGNMPNQAFYVDYVARAPSAGNLTVSIGKSVKGNQSEGGILNGLEIMKLRPTHLSSSGSRGRTKKILIVALSAVLGASVLACGVFCLFFVLRRRRQMPRPAPEEKESTPLPWSPYTHDGSGWVDQSSRSGEGTTVGLQRVSTQLHISLAEIKEATDNFHECNLIGVGGFGNVYRGVLRDGTRVAVKRAMRATKQGLPEFQTEIVVLSRIRHRHLVSLIGYCNEQGEMILVYEYMEKGTLRSHLYGSEEPPLSWKQRLEICIGAARGLHYLHTGYSENIIHRDVKSTNILLGDGFIAKVADFGLSRIGPSFGETHVSTAVKGSFGYMDPEYFKTQQLTDRSDVYSFGVLLLEVMCARSVIDQSLDRDQMNLAEWAIKWLQKGQLDKITDPRIIGQVNENSLRKFAETAEKCLADYGQNRPSMGDVLWNLEYCLQLQEMHVKRDAFEDSGAVATQFLADVVVPPRWMQSSNSFLTDDADETGMTEMGVANSKAEPGKIGLWGANNGTLHDIEGVPGRLESVTVCSGEVINSLAFSYIDRNGLQHAAGPWGGHAGSDHTVRTARDVRLELLEKITGGFSEEHKIGSGGYGKVYKGVLNGKEIAVKKLHCHVALDDVIFKNECENLMRVRHQNIVELVGYCHEIRHRYVEHNGRTVWAEMVDIVLCFEYLQNGSLDRHLYEEHRGLDWCTRYKIIKGICEGLNYLHGLEESILHLDLKPANILLDENMVPKIADFGLSRLFGGTHTHITKNPVGTEVYMPPEYVNECIITKKYDVFSLGVIIIQIMTGREGFSEYWEMSPQQFIELVHQNWKVRVEATSMHTSAGEDCKQVKRCIEIALNCVEPKRQKRPTIRDIIHKLRETETMTHEVSMPFSQESGSASSSHFKTEMVQNWSQEMVQKDFSNQQREVLQKQSGMQQQDSSNEQPGSLEKEYQEDMKKHAASGIYKVSLLFSQELGSVSRQFVRAVAHHTIFISFFSIFCLWNFLLMPFYQQSRSVSGRIETMKQERGGKQEIGPWGGSAGRAHSIKVAPHRLESVTIWSADIVDAFAFSHSDHNGSKHTIGPLGSPGGKVYRINFAPSEFLLEVSGTTGPYAWAEADVVQTLTLVTNTGSYGPFGKVGGGTPFHTSSGGTRNFEDPGRRLTYCVGSVARRAESQPIHVLRLSLHLRLASVLSRVIAPASSLSSRLIGASPPPRRSPYAAPQCSSDCPWTHTSLVLLCEGNFFSVLMRKSLLNYVPHATY